MYLQLRNLKSGTEINLTECTVFNSEHLERRDKLLMRSIASGKGALSMDNWTERKITEP